MQVYSAAILHVPMLYASGGLRGLSDTLPIHPVTLTIDNPYQVVGITGEYRISGAPPGEEIYWSSYKNGVVTGEDNAYYGQQTDASGNAVLQWMPRPEDVGQWIKEIRIIDSEGTHYGAQVQFVVQPAEPTPTQTGGGSSGSNSGSGSTPTPSSGGALDTILHGGFEVAGMRVPYIVPIVVVGGYFLLKKR